jgi:hypothetical protein
MESKQIDLKEILIAKGFRQGRDKRVFKKFYTKSKNDQIAIRENGSWDHIYFYFPGFGRIQYHSFKRAGETIEELINYINEKF